jgi:serine/threonine protein phosphatase PrpC
VSGWVKTRIELKSAEGVQLQGNAPTQEDYFLINPERGIFILADGFGGSVGRQAAQLVVESISFFLEQEAGDLDATLPFELRPYFSLAGNVLFNAIAYANQKLIDANRGQTWLNSGGASVLAGYLEGRLLALAQVGVCRLHLRRGEQVKELVAPRSLLRQVNPMLEEGEGDAVPLISFGTAKSLEPEITEVELRPGDQVYFETSGVKQALRAKILSFNASHELSQIIDGEKSERNASILRLIF